VAGLTDAALVLRHSIHETSSRVGRSHYDYQMYAIVHPQAEECSHVLADLGFTVVVKAPPVELEEIQDPYLRAHIMQEWCCGADEFVKLHAYSLPEVAVVHVDIDFVMHRPMDTVFDVLLYDKDSVIGQAARANLEVERTQSADQVIVLPDRPQALMTRDWPQVRPGTKALYQAGLLVARTNPAVLDELTHIIRTTPYGQDRTPEGPVGWGNKGYGYYVGALAMQGLLAYYYDVHAPDDWIELNQCRYNHMGMDVRHRKPEFRGQCRNGGDYCEECRDTPLEQIYNIHYTNCRKPWLCIGEGNDAVLNKPRKERTALELQLFPTRQVHTDHCLAVAQLWHDYRTDLETKLRMLTDDATIAEGQEGVYKQEVFQGHCREQGPGGYLSIAGNHESLKRLSEMYGTSEPTSRAVLTL
jgi:hypothetical protein